MVNSRTDPSPSVSTQGGGETEQGGGRDGEGEVGKTEPPQKADLAVTESDAPPVPAILFFLHHILNPLPAPAPSLFPEQRRCNATCRPTLLHTPSTR